MAPFWRLNKLVVAVILCLLLTVTLRLISARFSSDLSDYSADSFIDFEYIQDGHRDINITGFPSPIVPNIVHYVRLDDHTLDFIMYLSIKSAIKNQRPERVIIHCDCDALSGRYWKLLMAENDVTHLISINRIERPVSIFGQRLSSVYHASDIARIRALIAYGGIFLDNDSLIIKSLDTFRIFELTLGWPTGANMGTQVLLANKHARFLSLWLSSYQDNYKPSQWYYNAGEYPTKAVLSVKPEIVHREPEVLGVHMLAPYLYQENHPKTKWQSDFYAVHLLSRHRNYLVKDGVLLNEQSILKYNTTFGSMARDILYGNAELRSQ
ncbi:hypothetical protein HDE_06100 [Halotydeus destructor]|nr:hypothetical protein HDE_06100 [Halotydeus destructor]